MNALISSGRIVDVILVVLILEALFLALRHGASSGRVMTLLIAASPGVFLLLALRVALTGGGWPWIAVWLTASFPAHLADLWRRPPILRE
jgi:hypothetical protein